MSPPPSSRPAHAVDRLLERQSLDRRVVDRGDDVAGHQAGARRRRVVDRADDADDVALLHDLEAEPAEFLALHRVLEFAERLGVEVGRMRIERGEHAVDRADDHLVLVGLVDVGVAHGLEHARKQRQIVAGGRVGARRRLRSAAADERDREGAAGDANGQIGRRARYSGHDPPRHFGASGAGEAAGVGSASPPEAGAATAGAAGPESGFGGAASARLTPCSRSIAATSCLSSFSSAGT